MLKIGKCLKVENVIILKNVDTGSLSEDLTADGEWSGGPEMAPERGYFYVRTDGKLGR